MKPTPSAHAVQPARAIPSAVAAPERQADAHGRRLAKAQRHHEGHRRDLQRDRVGGDRVGVDQPHQIGRGAEHRRLRSAMVRPIGRPSRQSWRKRGQSAARSGRTRWKRRNWRSLDDDDRQRQPSGRIQTIELPSPPPKMPSAGRPKWPKISAQLTSALRTMPSSADRPASSRGRSSAERKLRIAWNSRNGSDGPHVAAQEQSAPSAASAGCCPSERDDRLRVPQHQPGRQRDADRAAHSAWRKVRRTSRTALARLPERGRHHRRRGGDHADAEQGEGEGQVEPQRRGGQRLRAEPAHQHARRSPGSAPSSGWTGSAARPARASREARRASGVRSSSRELSASSNRHCEERSDEAIQSKTKKLDCRASLAMTAVLR